MDPNAPATAQAPANEPAPTNSGMPVSNAPRRSVTNEPRPWDAPSTPAASPKASYPVGIAIPGKPGRVKSPWAQYAGEVDVKGIASGTPVTCPYSGKIFVVP